ncbi:MAG: DUF1232 domain-containing protein [Megasphaera sp.]|nr:DUF1232 domain-containing protein [Megasphaera sp.]MCH4187967.1 DUF1232 domain-containing protein [Megasphaera sp.]MCH4217687.1 DUF1232 domain-containing protein [Megasphaera sp.]
MWKLLSLFARFYTPGKFIRFIRTTKHKAHFIPSMLALYYCLQDKDTPKFVKLALMGALGYIIVPLDLLPDIIPGLGWIDDAAVLAVALRFAGAYIKPEHKAKVRHIIPFANI